MNRAGGYISVAEICTKINAIIKLETFLKNSKDLQVTMVCFGFFKEQRIPLWEFINKRCFL